MSNTRTPVRMTSLQARRLTYAAMYLAIAMVLPLVTGQIPRFGKMLCPMHIPALLCGFICGWPWGLAVGFIAPPLRSLLFGMPPMFPDAVAMAFELAVYGGAAGWLRAKLPGNKAMTYAVLILAMAAGRAVWGFVQYLLAGAAGSSFTLSVFFARAVTESIPGIILQLVLIPILVIAMEQAGLSLNAPERKKQN